MKRKPTRQIMLGKIPVGGGAPVSVQTMTKTDTRDVKATIEQIHELEKIGCDIIRVAVPDRDAAEALKEIKKHTNIPIVADIHFDYRLALLAIKNGVDGLRINPGNIGSQEKVREIVRAASDRHIPIRIGVNSGSLAKDILEKYGRTPLGLVESALSHVKILEKENFYDIKISVKATDVMTTIEAYRLLSARVEYPLHLGVTEAGTGQMGVIKSAVGIGTLLAEGIGDTIRVSLTGPPHEEVKVGQAILRALGLRSEGIEVISCPTCGRCNVDIVSIVKDVEQKLPFTKQELKIAVMGCSVNGPGEAREADVGIAGGKGCGLLFKKGKLIRKVPEKELVDTLIKEVYEILKERKSSDAGNSNVDTDT
ncbi:MAG: flavodoxin-dependent (E)-4-hydroxy-3-methylbut-2-enyl-diphosphate synthase [Thermacetogeniaceae bacterium]